MAEQQPQAESAETSKAKLYVPVFKLHSNQVFEPIDTIATTGEAAKAAGLIGALWAAAENSLSKSNDSALKRVRNGSVMITAITGAAAVTYFVRGFSANLRQKDDGINFFYGGLFGGAIAGSFTRSVPKTIGGGLGLGCILGVASWAGHLTGLGKDSTYEVLDKTEPVPKLFGETNGPLHLAHRRPLSQTIELLGEDSIALKK